MAGERKKQEKPAVPRNKITNPGRLWLDHPIRSSGSEDAAVRRTEVTGHLLVNIPNLHAPSGTRDAQELTPGTY